MSEVWQGPLQKIDDYRWLIPKSYKDGMRVDGLIYADEKLLKDIRQDKAPEQVANVAFLPGIVEYSFAMPDVHWGYGFAIGGVCATDVESGGVISPGGVGFDINCGVRLVRTNLKEEDVKPRLRELVASLFRDIPAGVGAGGNIKFGKEDEKKILSKGASFVVSKGFGVKEDIEHTEASGCLEDNDPDLVSDRAYERGKGQCGTLGSGNHFMEIQVVDELYDQNAAAVFGLETGQIVVMIHSGSRGLGYQVCEDYLHAMANCPSKYNINIPDRQLVCAPVQSEEGRAYIKAMRCAANYAWANRQILMHLCRQVFERFFNSSSKALGMSLIYDVAHNIAKLERYKIDGKERLLCVHRKGATRAFPPNHPEVPLEYRAIGQPVIIPGDMGRNSYILVGTAQAMTDVFGSSCHGAGRVMSRSRAIKEARGRSIRRELEEKGIIAMAKGRQGLDEEQPAAYKDVNEVVSVVHNAGIAKKVARMRPIGVVKG